MANVDKLSLSNMRLFINILLSYLPLGLSGSSEMNFNNRHYVKILKQ